jgi:exodeoxyribonuclease-3
MKIATWNVNSLNVRLPQVLDWLAANPVDALCLQELKLADEKFPIDAFTEIGYHAVWAGQKTYNGVAIISRQPGYDMVRNIPGLEDPQQRVLAVTLPVPEAEPVRVVSAYCPNGQAVGSDKYEYKLRWFSAFRDWLKGELDLHPRLAALGDYNVAPADGDVHDPEKWLGQVLVSEAERNAFFALVDLGLADAFRLFEQAPKIFSWWDYRQMGFRRNAGVRIDHILLSNLLAQQCTACVVDKGPRAHPQPSDHAPVMATLGAPTNAAAGDSISP